MHDLFFLKAMFTLKCVAGIKKKKSLFCQISLSAAVAGVFGLYYPTVSAIRWIKFPHETAGI